MRDASGRLLETGKCMVHIVVATMADVNILEHKRPCTMPDRREIIVIRYVG